MNYSKVKIGFGTDMYTDWDFVGKATLIQESMTGNLLFPLPKPTLVELSAALGNYTQSLNKAADGSKEDTVTKNNNRKALENMLRDLGGYVQTNSAGDEAKILSAGFDIHKKAEPIGPLHNATGLIVRYGQNSGQVTMECEVVNNAVMYEFQFTVSPITPTSVWEHVSDTKRKVNINGLTRGVEYVFRVAGINSDPSRNWSERVTKLVV